MKFEKESFEIIEQENTLDGLYKHIEKVGRTCYKSDNLIKEDSARPFVYRLIEANHLAMLEHGTVYLKATSVFHTNAQDYINPLEFYLNNKYSKAWYSDDSGENVLYVTTNLRVLVEEERVEDLKYLCEPTDIHEKRYTVKFNIPIGISREYVRHRVFSLAEQSTRYCNYSLNKFNSELTFIEDGWSDKKLLAELEKWYIWNTSEGKLKPQEARNMLPLCTKTELVMTGFSEDFIHFFNLRALGTTGQPHPQAKEIAYPLMEEFIKRGYIPNIKQSESI